MDKNLTPTRGNSPRHTQTHFVAYPRFLLRLPLTPSPVIMSADNHVDGVFFTNSERKRPVSGGLFVKKTQYAGRRPDQTHFFYLTPQL